MGTVKQKLPFRESTWQASIPDQRTHRRMPEYFRQNERELKPQEHHLPCLKSPTRLLGNGNKNVVSCRLLMLCRACVRGSCVEPTKCRPRDGNLVPRLLKARDRSLDVKHERRPGVHGSVCVSHALLVRGLFEDARAESLHQNIVRLCLCSCRESRMLQFPHVYS